MKKLDEDVLQDRIDLIQEIDFGISPQDKCDLVMVALGLKPAMEIIIVFEDKNPVQEIVTTLIDAGFEVSLSKLVDHPNGKFRQDILIANDVFTFNKLKGATTDEEFGKLYGFPETAISAYCSGERNDRQWHMEKFEEMGNEDYTY